MGTLVSAVRYPLKSARGQSLAEADVDAGGLRGDRAWACIDESDASAKHPLRWGRLLDVTASCRDDGDDCTLEVGGRRLTAGTTEAESVLGNHLGRGVRLTRDVPERAQLHRRLPEQVGLVPGWLRDVRPGQDLVTDVLGAPARWTLRRRRRRAPGDHRCDVPAGPAARAGRTVVLDHGRAACFGVYAEVVEQGRIRVGDPFR